MQTLTVWDINEEDKRRLRICAAENNRSMEAEERNHSSSRLPTISNSQWVKT